MFKGKKKSFYKVLFVTSGGGFLTESITIIKECPSNINLLIIGPDYLENKLRRAVKGRYFEYLKFRFSIRQDRDGGFFGNIPAVILGVMTAIEIIIKKRPHAVIAIGHRSASYFLIVARFFKIHTVFVESLTRVTKPGRTAKFISQFHLANVLYVQWSKIVEELKGSVYRGRIL